MYFGLIVPAYGKLSNCSQCARKDGFLIHYYSGYAYFAPTIINSYGYGGMFGC